ncbi:MAG: Gfo/Idh/MocA family oxidoreductase [Sphingomonas sp.]|nr:Gfo/Idh/MocA family oxidoreductase [Sphingomonas sp.]
MLSLGFVGTGWIGRNRMEAMLATGEAEAVAICDPNPEMVASARELAPRAAMVRSLEDLLARDLDGVVIATPSALHAEQCIRAFESGAAVFCQKPLGRHAAEVQAVLDAARAADRLLGVDLSYRHTAAMQAIRDRVGSGQLGQVFAADLTFHNAYGPQSGWFWDPKLSGGGCLIDLGVHLVDMLLWVFDFPEVLDARGTLLRDGRPARPDEVENYATAELRLANGVEARIACSWNLNAGSDAVIDASFYGTAGGAAMRNENGSFFDFSAELFHGQNREQLTSSPDDWGGRAAVEWVRKLAARERFEGSTVGLLETARVLDRLYEAVSEAVKSADVAAS